jgi:rod shape-determining protein MreD
MLSAAVVITALVLQLTVVNGVPWPGGGSPDLVLLVVVALGLCGSPASGALTGFLAGLSLDIAPPGSYLIGAYALVFCLVGYGCGRLGSPRADSVWRPVGCAVAAAAAGEALQAGLGRLSGDPQVTWQAVREVLPTSVVYDAILSPFVLYLLMRLLIWAEELGPGSQLAQTVSPEQARTAAALPGAGLLGGAGWLTGPAAGNAARAGQAGRVPRLREAAARSGDGWIGGDPASRRTAGGRGAGWRSARRPPRLRPGAGQAGSAVAIAVPRQLPRRAVNLRLGNARRRDGMVGNALSAALGGTRSAGPAIRWRGGRSGPAGSAFRSLSHRPAGPASRGAGHGPPGSAFRRRGPSGLRGSAVHASALHASALRGSALRGSGPRGSAFRGAGSGPRGSAFRGPGSIARGPAFREAGSGPRGSAFRGAGSGPRGSAFRGAGSGSGGSAFRGAGSGPRGSAFRGAGSGPRGPAFRGAGSGPRGSAFRGAGSGPRGPAFRGAGSGPRGSAFRGAGSGSGGSAFRGAGSGPRGSAFRGPGQGGRGPAWRRSGYRPGGSLFRRRGRSGPAFSGGGPGARLSLLAGSGAPALAPRFRLDARLPGGSAFGSPARRALPGRPATTRLRALRPGVLRRRDGSLGSSLARTGQGQRGLPNRPVRLRLGSSFRRGDGTVGGLAAGRFRKSSRKAAPRFRAGAGGLIAGSGRRPGLGSGKQARFRLGRRSMLSAWTGGRLGARSTVWRIGSSRHSRRLS